MLPAWALPTLAGLVLYLCGRLLWKAGLFDKHRP